MQEIEEDRDTVQKHYEPVLLYNESIKSLKDGFVDKALPRSMKVMDQQMCHCILVAVDFPGERVIVVETLRKRSVVQLLFSTSSGGCCTILHQGFGRPIIASLISKAQLWHQQGMAPKLQDVVP